MFYKIEECVIKRKEKGESCYCQHDQYQSWPACAMTGIIIITNLYSKEELMMSAALLESRTVQFNMTAFGSTMCGGLS